jgi:hypothetical protein
MNRDANMPMKEPISQGGATPIDTQRGFSWLMTAVVRGCRVPIGFFFEFRA